MSKRARFLTYTIAGLFSILYLTVSTSRITAHPNGGSSLVVKPLVVCPNLVSAEEVLDADLFIFMGEGSCQAALESVSDFGPLLSSDTLTEPTALSLVSISAGTMDLFTLLGLPLIFIAFAALTGLWLTWIYGISGREKVDGGR